MKILIVSIIGLMLAWFPAHTAEALSPERTRGFAFPHILKAETFTLNARNVKALKSQGKYLWLGTSSGILRYDTTTSERYELFDNQNGLLSNGIFTIAFDKEQRPWVGTYAGGLSYRDGSQWVNINTPQGLCDAFVYDVQFSGDAIWIATWSGANRVRGDPFTRTSWETFTVANTEGGLIDDWVYAIEIGRDGRVWFGTESGLSMFDGTGWQKWNHQDGLGAPFDVVKEDNRSVMSAFQGAHHAGTPPDLPNIETRDYRPNYIVAMLLDRSDRLWIGTWGGGLSLFDTRTRRFRNFTVEDGLPGNFILALREGPEGNLWIGSNAGLTRFDGTTFTNYSKINGLVSDFIFSIEFSPDGFLWVGGHFGVNKLLWDPAARELLTIE